MEGNFLSRYNNRISEYKDLILKEPHNKRKIEEDMSEYIIKCMPYLTEYIADDETNTDTDKCNTDNIFNVKETVGLKRSDIFRDYLIQVENQNISRPTQHLMDMCLSLIHI